jgi:nucleoside 2-deoxyribosyltransferase
MGEAFFDDFNTYECPRCGQYRLAEPALQPIYNLDVKHRPKLSRWVRDQNRLGTIPVIDVKDVNDVLAIPPLSFREKAERLLLYMVQNTQRLGQELNLCVPPEIKAILETYDEQEIQFVARYLGQRDWIQGNYETFLFFVTGDGFAKAEELENKTMLSHQAFVAMWFDESLKEAYERGLAEGIEKSGYKPIRIDTTQHNNKICDQIIAEIRRSRFIVADFTGQRGGVYYEAGFASGLNIPLIFTCRKDDLSKLHFDVRQFNTIDWESPPELAERLAARISATIGDGPLK